MNLRVAVPDPVPVLADPPRDGFYPFRAGDKLAQVPFIRSPQLPTNYFSEILGTTSRSHRRPAATSRSQLHAG